MNEKGMILPSVLVFILAVCIMLIGTASVYRNQLHQIRLTQNYYELRAMMELSKMELEPLFEESSETSSATVIFQNGTVHAQKIELGIIALKGELKNKFSLKEEYDIESGIKKSNLVPSEEKNKDAATNK